MSENISAYTTSITGLTCKPLSILSETISPQEMSMVRGGQDPAMDDIIEIMADEEIKDKDETHLPGTPEVPNLPDITSGRIIKRWYQ